MESNRCCASVVVACLLASTILAARGETENFLSNGSFEAVGEQGFPADWRLSRQPDDKRPPGLRGYIDTDTKRHGKQSLRIEAKGVTARYAGLMHATVYLDGPATYKFSGWIKAQDYAITPDGQAGDAVHAFWFWVTPRGTDQRLQSASLALGQVGTFDWTHTENEFKVPCPVTLTAGAWKGFNGTVWYDDIRIERVGELEVTQTQRGASVTDLVAGLPGALKSADGSFAVLYAPPVKKVTRRVTVEDGALAAGSRVRVSLARNEYEAVQLVIAPLAEDSLSVSFSASPLRGKGGGDTLEAASISIHPVGYVGYSDGEELITEPWPDPVLDDEEVLVLPDELQPLWVELYVPANAAAGAYETAVTLAREGKPVLEVPIDVTVYDFALPQAPTLPTAVASHSASARQNLLKHRMGLSYTCLTRPDFSANPRREREFSEVKPVIDEALAELASFGWRHFNVEIPRFPGTFLGGANSIGGFSRFRTQYSAAQREYIVRYYGEYAAYLKESGILDHATVYLYDEPVDEVFDFIRDCRELIRKADPDLQCMVVGHIWPELVGVVDVWCPALTDFGKEEAVARLRERQAAGEKVWAYNTTEAPPYAGWLVDPKCDLLSTRLLFWIVRKYGFDGFLHWACDRDVHPLVRLGKGTDCFLPKGPGAYVFGAGQLVYSEPVLAQDLDLNSRPTRMLPSLRLKAIRDGLEDHDYFVLLERAVAKAGARRGVRGVSRKTIAQAEKLLDIPSDIAASFTEYTHDAERVSDWRDRAARAIEMLPRESSIGK